MSAELSPNIRFRRDREGSVRQLSHPYERVGPDSEDASDEAFVKLASEYLDDFASHFGLDRPTSDGQAQEASAAARTDLKPVHIKRGSSNLVAITFDQYMDDLRIWRAGVTVRMDARRKKVTGSQNATHLDIRLHRAGEEARFAAKRVDAEMLKRLFELDGKRELTLDEPPSTLIFQYRAEDRVGPKHESQAPAGSPGAPVERVYPTLHLQELPAEILQNEGQHYVVTQVLFSIDAPGWGHLHWRAFIEPESGSVLYLRSLVSCATAHVFPTDPASASGLALTPSSSVGDLAPWRKSLGLEGLTGLDANQKQELSGAFVRLIEADPPRTPMPALPAPFDFDYQCDTADFAACSAYHHCDGLFRWMEGAGIDVHSYFTKTTFPVLVDPLAFDRGVNAQAVGKPGGQGLAQFLFGAAKANSDFGIATDPRVVLHEFGHALLWEHIGSPNFGFAHSPGDSLAAILLDPESKAAPGDTFPFIKGIPGFDRRHDRDVTAGWGWYGSFWDREYNGEQVLSSSLFRAYEAAGGKSAVPAEKKLASRYVAYLIMAAIESFHLKPQRAEDLVDALIEADARTVHFEGFPGGALGKVFRWAFEKQGLYQPKGTLLPANKPGAPPEVDIYIDDGVNGEYLPYVPNCRLCPGIWNRIEADDLAGNQQPRPGVINFAYLRVCNRGTAEARDISVLAFQTAHNGQRRWGIDWTPVVLTLGPIQPIPAGGSALVGPLPWKPSAADDHLLVCVSATGDPSSLDQSDPLGISVDAFVRLDNNVGERGF